MMAFTANGQLDPTLVEERDARFDVHIADLAADIPQPEVDPLADAWQHGEVIQLERVDVGN